MVLNIFLIVAITVEIGFVMVFLSTRFESSPKQFAQVEVVERRTTRKFSISSKDYSTYFTYIASFKFSDGSVKEFCVDKTSRRGNQDTAPNSFRYDAMQEGVTGILNYKEIADIEQKYENEEFYYDGRKFVSFKQNPEYGGALILSKNKNWDIWVWIIMGMGVIILGAIIYLIVLRIKIQKRVFP